VIGLPRAGVTARASNHERVRGGLRGKSKVGGTTRIRVLAKGISTAGSAKEIRSVVAIFTPIHGRFAPNLRQRRRSCFWACAEAHRSLTE